MYLLVVAYLRASCSSFRDNRSSIKELSSAYKHRLAISGAEFVPIGSPIVCWRRLSGVFPKYVLETMKDR